MKKEKYFNYLVNLLLFSAFLMTYFLDLTGVDWHQYLGVAACVFLLFHFIGHMEWISQVSARFLRNLSAKVRMYYLLDVSLLVAFFVITISGVAISTWLEIRYDLYPFLRDLHIISSIAGLALLMFKLVLHWKVIAHFVKHIQLSGFEKRYAGAISAPVLPAQSLTRRDALKTIGVISVVGIFGLYKAASAMALPSVGNILPDPQVKTAVTSASSGKLPEEPFLPGSTPEVAHNTTEGGQRRRQGQHAMQEGTAPTAVAPAQKAQVTPQATATPMPVTPLPPVQDCLIRCSRGCAYPGQCRRYIDDNSNQLCDLGECLPI